MSVRRQFLLPAAAALAGTQHTEPLHYEPDRSTVFHIYMSFVVML